MSLEDMSVILVTTTRMTRHEIEGGEGTGGREEGRTDEADLVGQEERQSCRSKPLFTQTITDAKDSRIARLFARTVASRVVTGTRFP